MKKLLLLSAMLIIASATNAQDTAKAQPPAPIPVQRQQPQPAYKIFMFEDRTAQALFNMLGVCPDEVKGDVSLKEMRQLFANEYNNQPKPAADTTAPAAKPKKKK